MNDWIRGKNWRQQWVFQNENESQTLDKNTHFFIFARLFHLLWLSIVVVDINGIWISFVNDKSTKTWTESYVCVTKVQFMLLLCVLHIRESKTELSLVSMLMKIVCTRKHHLILFSSHRVLSSGSFKFVSGLLHLQYTVTSCICHFFCYILIRSLFFSLFSSSLICSIICGTLYAHMREFFLWLIY